MKISLLVFLILSASILLSSCKEVFHARTNANRGVDNFHKLYNDGKLKEIYSACDSKFKNATSEKDFLDLMEAVQRKLGKVTKTANTGFDVRTFNLVTNVKLDQDTIFEQGKGIETFSFQVDGEKSTLIDYHIESKDLVLK